MTSAHKLIFLVVVTGSSASGPAAVLENGDHGIGDYNTGKCGRSG